MSINPKAPATATTAPVAKKKTSRPVGSKNKTQHVKVAMKKSTTHSVKVASRPSKAVAPNLQVESKVQAPWFPVGAYGNGAYGETPAQIAESIPVAKAAAKQVKINYIKDLVLVGVSVALVFVAGWLIWFVHKG